MYRSYLFAKKKGSTGGTGTCTALIFSLRLSGWPNPNSAIYFLLEELTDGDGLCSVALPYPNFNSSFMSHFKGTVRARRLALVLQCGVLAES